MKPLSKNNKKHWTASHLLFATNGRWASPPPSDWMANGLCIFAPTMQPGDMVAVRLDEGEKGVPAQSLSRLSHRPSALIASDPARIPISGIPTLHVSDVSATILALGEYARKQFNGTLIGVTGSAGKSTTVAMLAHVLALAGDAAQTRHNANLPHGVAWNLASIPWDSRYAILEFAIGRMAITTRMALPDMAIFTNILPAHLQYHPDLPTIADRKSIIFQGMAPGSTVVLNREMAEWERVFSAATEHKLAIINYGKAPDCDIQLLNYAPEIRTVTARAGDQELSYRIGVRGEHMALNSLATLAALMALDPELTSAITRLEDFLPLPGRGEESVANVGRRSLVLIDDAFNANPGSMASALAQLGEMKSFGRRVAILGEMLELGNNARAYHTHLASLIEQNDIDRVYPVGDLYTDFWDAVPKDRRGAHVDSPFLLQPILRRDLRSGDLVLVKGSHGTQIHNLVDWIKEGAPELGRHIAALLYDVEADHIVRVENGEKAYPPASLTKLLTLCLIEDRLQELGADPQQTIQMSLQAMDVDNPWGFEVGDHVPIDTLMRAAMIVSSNEAAHALAEWHSGSASAFTIRLNEQAAKLGMTKTRFASPSGLGHDQRITVHDTLTLARYVQSKHPKVSALATARSFKWKGKSQGNTNLLINEIPGANGLKTGRWARCFNLVFSVSRPQASRLAIVLGARSCLERDAVIRTLLEWPERSTPAMLACSGISQPST